VFDSLNRFLFPSRRSRRPTRRLVVERLEDRATPANIAVVGSTLQTATRIGLTYRATDVTQFDVGIFRSADPVLSADDIPITSATVTARATTLNQVAAIPLSGEISIDPARPYVLAVADPNGAIDETNEADNIGQFRKLAMAVVTHGFEPTGKMPSWLDDMAAGLRREGFAQVIEFDWAASSRIPLPGLATLAGWRMAQQVRLKADALGTLPTDVVDVQFIGHSRGTVVISQALASLQVFPGPRELRLGYFQMTMLDPHPAHNRGSLFAGFFELLNGTGVSNIGGFSFDPTNRISLNVGRAMLAFQAAARDPSVIVPANVDKAEVFYQRQPWFETVVGGFENLIGQNVWGDSPAELINRSGKLVVVIDISKPPTNAKAGHTAVPLWYIETILPPVA
jgi:hypothetical protein